jgi:AraC-like DNA-binding protein
MKDGDICLINPREVHSFKKNGDGNICLILQFNPSVITEVYPHPFAFRLNTATDEFLPSSAKAEARRILATIGLLLQTKPDGYQFDIRSGLYSFAGMLFRNFKYEKLEDVKMGDLRDFDAIKLYIKEHFKESVDQEHISRALGMSKAKIYRVLKAGGTSAKDMLNFYRVERAKHLLKNSLSSSAHIACESGFESVASFYRVFREIAGMAPQEHRANPAQKIEPVGIQGYAKHSVPESLKLLRKHV